MLLVVHQSIDVQLVYAVVVRTVSTTAWCVAQVIRVLQRDIFYGGILNVHTRDTSRGEERIMLGSTSIAKQGRSTLWKLMTLRWRRHHHGVNGLIALSTGFTMIVYTLQGDPVHREGFHTGSLLMYAYLLTSCMNCISGWWMVRIAPKASQAPFQAGVVLQSCILYYIWRFGHDPTSSVFEYFQTIDILIVLGTLWSIARCFLSSLYQPHTNAGLVCAVGSGCCALLLLCGYPLQLALFGKQWYTHVLYRYPRQADAFINFVYVPTSWGLSAIFFLATLLNRNIMKPLTFSIFFLFIVLVLFITTVIVQEVHLGCVSSQKLLLFGYDESPLQKQLSHAVDTSTLAQWLLTTCFPNTHFDFLECGT